MGSHTEAAIDILATALSTATAESDLDDVIAATIGLAAFEQIDKLTTCMDRLTQSAERIAIALEKVAETFDMTTEAVTPHVGHSHDIT